MSKRILIADDEPNIVVSLEFLMRREGFDVQVAVDGEAALQAIAAQVPDLILLDIMLPRCASKSAPTPGGNRSRW
jgi:DNA-binding response OmpR family regulator